MNERSGRVARHGARQRAGRWLVSSIIVSCVSSASAQVGEGDARLTVFYEPSSSSSLTVLNPAAGVSVTPAEWLSLGIGYEADIVTGASESIKAGPLTDVDVVSSATDFSDVRHVGSVGFEILRDTTSLSGSYTYGFESDYRSHALLVGASHEFARRNSRLELSYGRGFDEVCTAAWDQTLAPSARPVLDSSEGCFTGADDRAARNISLDNFQTAWTQNWTPVFNTQLVVTAGLQHGFLGNPYRAVVVAPAGDVALENHPDDRARGALALRGKYYVREWETALSLGARLYRDTWDIFSQTVELSAERYMLSWLRLKVRGRFYSQSEALFWSDDYTGGEPETGPRGQYWTGDRELSPLNSYLLGGRVLITEQGGAGSRVLGIFTTLNTGAALDLVKTDLKEFTWGGVAPDDTFAIIGTLSASGVF